MSLFQFPPNEEREEGGKQKKKKKKKKKEKKGVLFPHSGFMFLSFSFCYPSAVWC